MKILIILLVVCIIALSSVHGQAVDVWTKEKCGIENQGVYNRGLGYDTCNDLCKGISSTPTSWSGVCELNGGYGFCKCVYASYPFPPA